MGVCCGPRSSGKGWQVCGGGGGSHSARAWLVHAAEVHNITNSWSLAARGIEGPQWLWGLLGSSAALPGPVHVEVVARVGAVHIFIYGAWLRHMPNMKPLGIRQQNWQGAIRGCAGCCFPNQQRLLRSFAEDNTHRTTVPPAAWLMLVVLPLLSS